MKERINDLSLDILTTGFLGIFFTFCVLSPRCQFAVMEGRSIWQSVFHKFKWTHKAFWLIV